MANEFRFECKQMIQNGQRNRKINVEQQISAGLGEWLKQKELVLIENDKGRADSRTNRERVVKSRKV